MTHYFRVLSRWMRPPEEIGFRLCQFFWNSRKRLSPPVDHLQTRIDLAEDFRTTFFAPYEEQKNIAALIWESFEGYAQEMCNAADEILNGNFKLLGFEKISFGDIGDIDFHYDPIHQVKLPPVWWKKVLKQLDISDADPKIIWELNRHQYLVQLGIAYRLTGKAKYKEFAQSQIATWIAKNPPFFGINWSSSLELAYRAISWLWACQLFHFDESWDDYQNFLGTLMLHGRFIEHNLSTYHSPNTHITGEALGLYYLGTAFSDTKDGERWLSKGNELLLHFLDMHILDDGGYIERSFWYHRYTVEIFHHFYLLSEKNNQVVPDKVRANFEKATSYLYETMTPDCTMPRFGDDDGGKLIRLDGGFVTDSLKEILCCSGIIFDHRGYWQKIEEFEPSLLFLIGASAYDSFLDLSTRSSYSEDTVETGITGFHFLRSKEKSDESYLAFDTGPLGWLNCGHGHADTLSFIVYKGSRKVVVDPGTFTYSGTKRNRYRGEQVHSTLSVDGIFPAVPSSQPFHWLQTPTSLFLGRQKKDDVTAMAGRLFFSESPLLFHDREIYHLFPNIFVIRDFISGRGEHTITRRLPLSGTCWQIEALGRCVDEQNNFSIECVEKSALEMILEPFKISELYGNDQPATLMVMEIKSSLPLTLHTIINLSALNTHYELKLENNLPVLGVYDEESGEKRELPSELFSGRTV